MGWIALNADSEIMIVDRGFVVELSRINHAEKAITRFMIVRSFGGMVDRGLD